MQEGTATEQNLVDSLQHQKRGVGSFRMHIMNLWNLQGQLLLLLVAGILLRRLNILSGQAKHVLTDLVIYVTLPCSIVLSFRMDIDHTTMVSLGSVLLIAFAIQVFCIVLGNMLYRKQDKRKQAVLRYGILVSNSGFMGLPIAGELYGVMGAMYASIYLIPQRVVMWTAGLSCFTANDQSWRQKTKKIVRHPGMVSVYIGLFLLVFNLPIPRFLIQSMESVAVCTTPLSMLLIGAIIGEMNRSEVRITYFSLLYTAVRLILIPGISFIVLRLSNADTVITAVSVLLAGMPVGSTTAILAAKYGGDASFASQLVAISTILSLISIPLWALIL
jgi:predicted permease